MSRQAVWPTQPYIRCISLAETWNSSLWSSYEFKNVWSHTFTLLYPAVTWCLNKQRHNVAFPYVCDSKWPLTFRFYG
jgi:hypothetical protein